MSLIRISIIILFFSINSSCAAPKGEVSGDHKYGIQPGQWVTPVSAGNNQWLIRAWDTGTAMQGGATYCSRKSKQVQIISLTPQNTYRTKE